jgi:hypothetical protein
MIFHHVPSFSRDFPMLSKLSVSFRHRTNVRGWDLNCWARPVVAANLPLSWDSHGVAVPAEAHFFRENWYNGKNNVYIYIIFTILLSLWLSNNNIMCILTIIIYYCHYIYSVNNNNNNNNDNNNGNNNNNNDMYVYMSI